MASVKEQELYDPFDIFISRSSKNGFDQNNHCLLLIVILQG